MGSGISALGKSRPKITRPARLKREPASVLVRNCKHCGKDHIGLDCPTAQGDRPAA